jgi:hypothetical protein
MIRRFSILLVLILLEYSSALAAGDIVLRTSVQPEKAWLGQRVILQIDVLGSDGWTQITGFDDIEIPGAYLMRTDSQGTRLQQTIDGTSYSGQRYEFSIYPQAAGTIEVPAIAVEVKTKGWGADAGDSIRQARAPAVTLLANIPAGAENVRGLISTIQLTVEQNWQSQDETRKVGDAVKRTIRLQAIDISGMAFTPLQHKEIPGVGIYPAQPAVEDSSNRGSLNGSRTEVVTYVFEQPGKVQIPDIEFIWWNLADSKLEQVKLPGRLIRVAAGAGSVSAAETLPVGQLEMRYLAAPVILLLLVGFFLYRFRRELEKRCSAWRVAREESEESYFRSVVESIRLKKSAAVLRQVMRWLDRINDAKHPAQLDGFIDLYGDTRAKEVIKQLLHSVAAGEQLADPAQLLDVLSTARRNWRKRRKQRQLNVSVLPALNPDLRQ